jgi:hypothetical protein
MATKTSTPARKAMRERSYARGQVRKANRVEAQDKRAQANRVRRANGEPTPWEQSKLDAKMKKAAA